MVDSTKHGSTLQRSTACDFLIILVLCLGFAPVFQLYWAHYWDMNTMNGAYSHAPIALLVPAYLVWRQRAMLYSHQGPGFAPWRGYLLLLCGVLLKIYGDVEGYIVLRGMALIPVLFGILCIKFPLKTCRAMLYPVLFLFFIIPLPTFAIDQVTWVLQRFAVELVAPTLSGLGYPAKLDGFVLAINDPRLPFGHHEIIIGQSCSGIRSLVALFALSSLYAYLRGFRLADKALVLALVLPLNLLGNFCRIMLTTLMVIYIDPQTAESFFHEFSGVVIFCTTIAGLFLLENVLQWGRRTHKGGDISA